MRRLIQCMMLLTLCLVGLPTTSAQTVKMQATQVQTFDVTVSLEWQPGTSDLLDKDLAVSQCNPATGAGGNYLDELRAGLSRASDYLALYSGGQMRLGTVTVYTGGVNWNKANIRVLADSSYRPKAFVGGIVSAPMTYTSPNTQRTQTFYPGAIYLGRLWDGKGARCGPWSLSNGYRTIGHEWAHYALYLYDEYYQQHDLAPVYCTTTNQHLPSVPAGDPSIDTNDSLMAYHYRAGQLWRGGASNGTCDFTPQMHVHGESDWETVQRFYPNVVIPSGPTPAPPSQPIQWSVATVSTLPLHSSANVRVRNTVAAGTQLSGHGYIVRTINQTPQRIIGQGAIVADEAAPLPFLGVEDRDRAVIVMQDPQTGAHFTANSNRAPLVVGQDKLNELYLQRSSWRPCMSITPAFSTSGGISQVTQLTVRLRDCANRTSLAQLAYCPSGGNCQALVTKPIDATGSFVHTFTFPWGSPPAEYGYIYARSADSGEEQEETIAWYQLAGGVGPATITGHAPLLEGTAELSPSSSSAQVMSGKTDSYLLYSGVLPYRTGSTALPSDVGGIVNIPLDIQPVVSNGAGSTEWSASRYDPALSVRLSYNQDLLDRLRIGEERLVLLRLDQQGGWRKLTSRQRSLALDWLAVDPQSFNGSGLSFALGYLRN